MNPRRSFSARLTLAMALLVALTLGAVTYVTVRTVRTTLTDQIGENFQTQAESLNDLVSLFLIDKASQLQVLAGSESIKHAVAVRNASYSGSVEEILSGVQALDQEWIDAADDDPLIKTITASSEDINPAAHQVHSFLNSFEAHSEVFVTDRYGATVGATGRLSDYYQADEEWWQAGWNDGQGGVYISEPEFDESAGVTALLIAAPVFNEAGEVIGVLRSTLNVSELYELISAVRFGDSGYVMLLSASGETLFQPTDASLGVRLFLPERAREDIAGAGPGFIVADGRFFAHAGSIGSSSELEGEATARAQAAQAVVGLGWMTVVSQSTDEAFASIRTIMRVSALVGAIAVAVASLAAFALARAISQRLVALSKAASAISGGDLAAPVPVSGSDEVGRLSRAFSEMTSRLGGVIEELREQARRDSLTGVLNHAAIVTDLRDVIEGKITGSPDAVVMVDVDGLKAVNDTYGHQVGDAVLVAVSTALSEDGVTVGRYGGDEFVVVLAGTDRAGAEQYRRNVLERLADAALVDPETGSSVPVVASIGLAVCPDDARTLETLIQASDAAMYAQKRERRAGESEWGAVRPLGTDRAAELVGQLVPLLTAPGDVHSKLELVSKRLSVGAGYDAVNISMFSPLPGEPLANSTFAHVPEELVEAWNVTGTDDTAEKHPIRKLFERTPHPVILDDPWNDDLLVKAQRDILRAADLKSVLVAPLTWDDQVVGSLGVAAKREHAFTPSDAQFLDAVANHVTAIIRMATLVNQLESSAELLVEAREQTVLLLAASAEAHDPATGRHLRSLRGLVEALAEELGHEQGDAQELGLAAVLHDIGKIRVPEGILAKPGNLAEDEWELMKRHTAWGAEFLTGYRGFELAADIARSHHERWDGAGYPDQLSGEDIPKAATIVSVADAFDAMTSDRPYRKARPTGVAIEELIAFSGDQFNPTVVQALVALHERGALARLRAPVEGGRAAA